MLDQHPRISQGLCPIRTKSFPYRRLPSFMVLAERKGLMRRVIPVIWYGCIVWLIPFLLAIPFYSPDGTLVLDEPIFKSIMIVVGSLTGAYLLVRYYRNISGDYIREGFFIGGAWLLINWGLDFFILMPLSGMDIMQYFAQIGIRYLMIPIMSVMSGYIAAGAGSR